MSTVLDIPDALPMLSKGNHIPGSGRACIMDAISLLSGRDQDLDQPANVLPVLRPLFIRVNDRANDTQRQELWPLGIRAMGTATPGDIGLELLNHKVVVSLLMAQAMRQFGTAPPGEHSEGVKHLGMALRWIDHPAYNLRMAAWNIPAVLADISHCRGCHFARHAAKAIHHAMFGSEALYAHMDGLVGHTARMRFLGQVMDDVEAVLASKADAPDEEAWAHMRQMVHNKPTIPISNADHESVANGLLQTVVATSYSVPANLLQPIGTWWIKPSNTANMSLVSTT